jgi:outer membrane protein assembly factor BamB
VLDPNNGVIVKSRNLQQLGGSAVCSMVRNEERIYVAGLNYRFHAINAEDYLTSFSVSAPNNSKINFVAADENLAIYTTERGNVIAITADGPKKTWQRDVAGPISAEMVKDDSHVYIPCQDTKLYKFNAKTGKDAWPVPFQTGNAVLDSPTVGKSVVYQYIDDHGVYAIDKQTGEKIWQVQDGKSFIAENGPMAYVFAAKGNLIVMDNEKAKMLYSVNLAGVTDYIVNTVDSTIYIADDDGRVMSIKTNDYYRN